MISELKLISGGLFRCLKRGYSVEVGKKELVLKQEVGTGLKNQDLATPCRQVTTQD